MDNNLPAVTSDDDLIRTLQNSLYPGATRDSVELVLSYCRAAKLDVMQKPVHIVPMWDKALGRTRDVVMPGIGSYRIAATRTGEHVGTSEPEFGPTIEVKLGSKTVAIPEWCKVTVKRAVRAGLVAEFSSVERWLENYASVKRDDPTPNAMWSKRPFAQLAKCAEAQALRRAFPELGAAPTADEMEGREDWEEISAAPKRNEFMPQKLPVGDVVSVKVSVDPDKVTVTPPEKTVEGEHIEACRPLPPKVEGDQTINDAQERSLNLTPATSGMKKIVRGKLTEEKSETVMRMKFGFGVEDMPAATVNQVLAWLKGA